MLDSDLATLYGVETKVLNQAVKRNSQRFPEDFMFKLTKEECLRSQIVTSNKSTRPFSDNRRNGISYWCLSQRPWEETVCILENGGTHRFGTHR